MSALTPRAGRSLGARWKLSLAANLRVVARWLHCGFDQTPCGRVLLLLIERRVNPPRHWVKVKERQGYGVPRLSIDRWFMYQPMPARM